MIRIINLHNKNELKENEILFKIDRSSVLGNPFHMYTESQRDDVCDKYAQYFTEQMERKNSEFYKAMVRLYRIALKNDVALGCWCYPKRCHGNTIKTFLDKYLIEEQK